jgi:hypothetical protein
MRTGRGWWCHCKASAAAGTGCHPCPRCRRCWSIGRRWCTVDVGVLDLDAGRRLHLVGIGCGHRLGTIPHELLDPAVHALEVEAVDAARREGIGRDPLELVTVGDVIFRQAQRLPPLLRGQQRRFDGAEQLLQRHAVQRLGPLLEREGSALPHPGELVLQLAQLPIGVVQVRVLRSLLRRQGAILLDHPVLGHPHGRPTAHGRTRSDGAGLPGVVFFLNILNYFKST